MGTQKHSCLPVKSQRSTGTSDSVGNIYLIQCPIFMYHNCSSLIYQEITKHQSNILLYLQALEAEIQSHEPVISTVNSRAQQMIRSGHFASADIEAKIKQLLLQLSQLKDTASLRRLRLLDAVESQMVSKILGFWLEKENFLQLMGNNCLSY